MIELSHDVARWIVVGHDEHSPVFTMRLTEPNLLTRFPYNLAKMSGTCNKLKREFYATPYHVLNIFISRVCSFRIVSLYVYLPVQAITFEVVDVETSFLVW